MLTAITPALLFAAFILLLLVSLSAPIIDSIYLLRLSADVSIAAASGQGHVDYGVWGYCVSTIRASVFGVDRVLQPAECTDPKLGFQFDSRVASLFGVDDFSDTLSRAITTVLVLHPIACGLTFGALVISLFMLRRGSNGTSRLPSILTLALGLLAALVTTAIFLIDAIAIAVVRNRVRDRTDGDVDLDWGNAVWMTLGATVALWLAMVGACAGVCACGGRTKPSRY